MAIVFFFFLFGPVSANVILNTTSGPVRGTTVLMDIKAFLGIPYAEPPVGHLRFAKPLPKQKWQDVYNAFQMHPPCAQISTETYYFSTDVTNMSEDCLYLNIWVPKYTHGLRPIIVFIHSGTFMTGSSNHKVIDGSKLAKQGDLIVVTINCRIGSFGYFLGYIKEANGNMGMYDQIMAIKWIKDNAEIFGGDPDNIVLMGQSAGSASISAHLVSPLSQSLFKRAIMESGSIIMPNFQDENVKLFENSQEFASIAGCTNETTNLNNDPHEVVDCLKTKPTEELVAAEKTLRKSHPITFFPRINDEFLPKSAVVLFREGKFRKDVDVLMGVNHDEGTMMLVMGRPSYFGHYGENSVQSFTKLLATFIAQRLITMSGQQNASEIINFYTKLVQDQTSFGSTKMVANIIGDYSIACGTVFNADLLSLKGNKVFFYKLAFRAASTPMAEWIGVTNMDELQYVFGNPYHDNFTAEEVELSTRLMVRWSTFAKYGNPNVPGYSKWLQYKYHKPLYLDIGQKKETMRMTPLDRCDIWRKRFNADIDDS